jgi:peroxiredoxin
MATTVTAAVLGTPAVDFQLPATDGKVHTLDEVAGEKGTVIVFIRVRTGSGHREREKTDEINPICRNSCPGES